MCSDFFRHAVVYPIYERCLLYIFCHLITLIIFLHQLKQLCELYTSHMTVLGSYSSYHCMHCYKTSENHKNIDVFWTVLFMTSYCRREAVRQSPDIADWKAKQSPDIAEWRAKQSPDLTAWRARQEAERERIRYGRHRQTEDRQTDRQAGADRQTDISCRMLCLNSACVFVPPYQLLLLFASCLTHTVPKLIWISA